MITKEQYKNIKIGDKLTSHGHNKVYTVVSFCYGTHWPVAENQNERICITDLNLWTFFNPIVDLI